MKTLSLNGLASTYRTWVCHAITFGQQLLAAIADKIGLNETTQGRMLKN